MFKEALTYDDIKIIPRFSKIENRSDCNLQTRFTRNFNIDKPYVSAPMDTVTGYHMALRMYQLGGVGCIHRFMNIEEQIDIIKELILNLGVSQFNYTDIPICASIGVSDSKKRLQELIKYGVNVVLIDVAHGNTDKVKRTIEFIKNSYKGVDIIAGNVATSEGAKNLCEWGVDGIRVGIGNGSLCETRIRTGVGVPQVTALMDCVSVADEYNVPVIADGGVRMVGDVAKALALGADSVMLGSILSGTKESPGNIQKSGVWPNEQLYKKYRGSASLEAKIENSLEQKNVEGNSKLIPYKGKIKRLITDIDDGLRSSMSYVDAKNLEEFRSKSSFVKVTQNGMIEAKPHLLL